MSDLIKPEGGSVIGLIHGKDGTLGMPVPSERTSFSLTPVWWEPAMSKGSKRWNHSCAKGSGWRSSGSRTIRTIRRR